MTVSPTNKKLVSQKHPQLKSTAQGGPVQSLSRGLTLLEYISESPGGIAFN